MKIIEKYKLNLIATACICIYLIVQFNSKQSLSVKDFIKFQKQTTLLINAKEKQFQDSLKIAIKEVDRKLKDAQIIIDDAMLKQVKNSTILSIELQKLKNIRYEKVNYSDSTTNSLLKRLRAEN